MANRMRCSHPTAYEKVHPEKQDADDSYPKYWYCPRCETYYPLIGDDSYWIVYIPTDDNRTVQETS